MIFILKGDIDNEPVPPTGQKEVQDIRVN